MFQCAVLFIVQCFGESEAVSIIGLIFEIKNRHFDIVKNEQIIKLKQAVSHS